MTITSQHTQHKIKTQNLHRGLCTLITHGTKSQCYTVLAQVIQTGSDCLESRHTNKKLFNLNREHKQHGRDRSVWALH